MDMTSLTHCLASYATQPHLTTDDIPAFQAAFLDWLSTAIASRDDETLRCLLQIAQQSTDAQGCIVPGQKGVYSASWAALLGAAASHAQDFDDIHLSLSLHLNSPVFGAAFSCAQYTEADWEDLFQAVGNGMQIMAAIAYGIMPEHYRQRWHSTSTLGVFGAAAAAAFLLELDSRQMCCAFGLAASLSCGLQQNFGTMAKPLQAGMAARHGLEAAILAGLGFTANETIFDTGFLEMLSPRVNKDAIRSALQMPNALHDLCFKQFPCGMPTHAGIINMRKLRNTYGLTPNDVDKVVIETTSHGMRMAGNTTLTSGMSGKFSICFCAAAAFIDGWVNSDTFTDEMANRRDIRDLMAKIELVVNDSLAEHSLGSTTIYCRDGRKLSSVTRNIRQGKTEHEQFEAVREKFLDVTSRAFGVPAGALETVLRSELPTVPLKTFADDLRALM